MLHNLVLFAQSDLFGGNMWLVHSRFIATQSLVHVTRDWRQQILALCAMLGMLEAGWLIFGLVHEPERPPLELFTSFCLLPAN